jgi:chaperonin GroES
MATNIKPLHDRVIVRRIEEAGKSAGGIFIPDTAHKDKPQQGEVIAVGEGRVKEDGTRQPLDVRVGDHVVFSKYGGNEVKIDDEELLILKEDDIYGIVERAGAASSSKKGGK